MSDLAKSRVGDKSPGWKGGIYIDYYGYLRRYMPMHPFIITMATSASTAL